jgi:hypothetical protein
MSENALGARREINEGKLIERDEAETGCAGGSRTLDLQRDHY